MASAARTGSAGALPGGLPGSGSGYWGRAIRTYASKPGGPYRTRSHQSTSDRSNHRAGYALAARRISVTLISVVQGTRQANCIFTTRSAVGCRRSPGGDLSRITRHRTLGDLVNAGDGSAALL